MEKAGQKSLYSNIPIWKKNILLYVLMHQHIDSASISDE